LIEHEPGDGGAAEEIVVEPVRDGRRARADPCRPRCPVREKDPRMIPAPATLPLSLEVKNEPVFITSTELWFTP